MRGPGRAGDGGPWGRQFLTSTLMVVSLWRGVISGETRLRRGSKFKTVGGEVEMRACDHFAGIHGKCSQKQGTVLKKSARLGS